MRHPKLDEFIRLFNERLFFEAHEILEELWLETSGEQKLFYQGLIQCAVSLAHWKRNNPRGANQVGARSFSILEKYEAERDGIFVQELISHCRNFLDGKTNQIPTIKTANG